MKLKVFFYRRNYFKQKNISLFTSNFSHSNGDPYSAVGTESPFIQIIVPLSKLTNSVMKIFFGIPGVTRI